MNPNDNIFPLYYLANYKFQNVQITTEKNETIYGQFVAFAIIKGIVETYYPNDAYCFVPKIAAKEFWDSFNDEGVNGKFKEFPKQVKLYKQHEITKIVIIPILR